MQSQLREFAGALCKANPTLLLLQTKLAHSARSCLQEPGNAMQHDDVPCLAGWQLLAASEGILSVGDQVSVVGKRDTLQDFEEQKEG